MKWRSTVLLVLLLTGLLFLYWVSNWWKEEQKVVIEEAKRIFSFTPESVRELHIQQSGGPLCVGKKNTDGKWIFEKPSADIPAFQLMWERVAKHFSELKNQRTIVKNVDDLSVYGLDKPSLKLEAIVDGYNEPIELQFGFLDPTNTYRYTLGKTNEVFLVDDKQFFELNRSLEDLRFRFLVAVREIPLIRIEFARIWTEDDETKDADYLPKIGEESITVIMERKNENEPWYLISPTQALADQEAVNALASEIQFGIGRDFIDKPESLSDYGLDPPRCRLTYYDAKEKKPQTLFLGGLQTAGQSTQEKDKEKRKRLKLSECTGVFAKLAGQNSVFLLDPHILELLPRSPESYRNRHVFTTELANLIKIERLNEKNIIFTLEKNPEKGWIMTQPPIDDIDSIKINDYINKLKAIELQSFPGGTWEERGLNTAKDILRFTLKDQKVIELRYISVPDDNLHSYMNQDTGDIGIISNDIISQLWVLPENFRSLLLYRFALSEINEIQLTYESIEYIFQQIDKNWIIKKPEEKILKNQGDLLRLLRYLSTMSAVDIVHQEEGNKFIEQPLVKLSILQGGGKQSTTMTLGTLIIGSLNENDTRFRWAKKEGKEGIYLIKQDVVDIIKDLMKSIQDIEKKD